MHNQVIVCFYCPFSFWPNATIRFESNFNDFYQNMYQILKFCFCFVTTMLNDSGTSTQVITCTSCHAYNIRLSTSDECHTWCSNAVRAFWMNWIDDTGCICIIYATFLIWYRSALHGNYTFYFSKFSVWDEKKKLLFGQEVIMLKWKKTHSQYIVTDYHWWHYTHIVYTFSQT